MNEPYNKVKTDVLVIGAGGAGLRAAISAADAGLKTTVVSKSLIGKAHTVMAEGGIAASLGNVDPKDNWQVHFGDIMEEGVYLSNWRIAEILAKEVPERVFELEKWGALFDRTPDGRILQRAFGGHTYRRLCHVGDRTGLELIRTLQDQALHRDIDILDELYITKLVKDGDRVTGAIGIKMNTGEFYALSAKAVVIATGGAGKVYKVTSNSWESTGDGIKLAYEIGATLMDMEMFQFHPTGMVYPPGVRGLLVTEGVRGEGGILLNNKMERYMLKYSPEKKELDARDVVARANYAEIQAGRGTEHGGVYLDITHKSPQYIKEKLPHMYMQYLEFAGVDITKEKMEVAPTIHYQMGGIRFDPETCMSSVNGLFAAGEVACGLHGANRLGGNSLADILVFGRRAGNSAAEFAKKESLVEIPEDEVQDQISSVLSFLKEKGTNPYSIMDQLTTAMSDNVGILRDEDHLNKGLEKILELKKQYASLGVPGGRRYNHGLLACMELKSMLIVSEAIVRSALLRKESRGAHARTDYPKKSKEWLKNIIINKDGENMKFDYIPVQPTPPELAQYYKPEVYS
ncbi:FAD-binding protein [Oxyplasma meridianum]|uniref:FAD-binding protein n=1 Tax=Oxyplasma meridianum TaxID=3073602 RepID=A0AAX4NGE5_9ARCH